MMMFTGRAACGIGQQDPLRGFEPGVVPRDSLPRNPNGKILTRWLRAEPVRD